MILLMDKILHDPKDPKLWELWYIPYKWVMQDFVHQPYHIKVVLTTMYDCYNLLAVCSWPHVPGAQRPGTRNREQNSEPRKL